MLLFRTSIDARSASYSTSNAALHWRKFSAHLIAQTLSSNLVVWTIETILYFRCNCCHYLWRYIFQSLERTSLALAHIRIQLSELPPLLEGLTHRICQVENFS